MASGVFSQVLVGGSAELEPSDIEEYYQSCGLIIDDKTIYDAYRKHIEDNKNSAHWIKPELIAAFLKMCHLDKIGGELFQDKALPNYSVGAVYNHALRWRGLRTANILTTSDKNLDGEALIRMLTLNPLPTRVEGYLMPLTASRALACVGKQMAELLQVPDGVHMTMQAIAPVNFFKPNQTVEERKKASDEIKRLLLYALKENIIELFSLCVQGGFFFVDEFKTVYAVIALMPCEEDSSLICFGKPRRLLTAEIDWMVKGVKHCLENKPEDGSSFVRSSEHRKRGALFFDWISPHGERISNKSGASVSVFKTDLNGGSCFMGGYAYFVPKVIDQVKGSYTKDDIDQERSCFIPLKFAKAEHKV